MDETNYPSAEFDQTHADTAAFTLHFFLEVADGLDRQRRKQIFIGWMVFLPTMIICSSIVLLINGQLLTFVHALMSGQIPNFPLIMIAGIAIGFLLVWLLLKLLLRKSAVAKRIRKRVKANRDKVFSGRTRVELRDTEIHSENPIGRHSLFWSAIRTVSKTADYIFVYATNGFGFLVPKRAFKNQAEFDHFFDLANKLWRTHMSEAQTINSASTS